MAHNYLNKSKSNRSQYVKDINIITERRRNTQLQIYLLKTELGKCLIKEIGRRSRIAKIYTNYKPPR